MANGIGPLGAGSLRRLASRLGSGQAKNPHSRNALHLVIVSALGLCGAAMAGQAQASCNGASNQDLSAGDYGYSWSICNGAAGTDSKDEKDGARGDSITITTEGTYATDAGVPPYGLPSGAVGGVIMTYTRGGDGVDEGNAGGGGGIGLTSHNSVTVSGTGNSGYLGSLISAYSWGGNGDSDNDNNDSDGGDGGAGSAINVTNYGTLTIDGTVTPLSGGMYGILAVSGGGTGGEQNNSTSGLGDQIGGDGGSAGSVFVSNSGTINIGSTSSRMQGIASGAGIYADSGGGGGGVHNGGAGNGGSVTVQHDGQINNVWNNTTQGGGEIFGIHARSIGGIGTGSTDNSDDGGRGGDASTVTVTSTGGILLDVSGDFTGEGAAIAARSVGEQGGTGPSKDESGGNGGSGNSATVTLQGPNGRITTNGDNLYGILTQSLGGQGGDGGDSTALAGQGGGGGFGGNAGAVTVTTDAGTIITTSGDYSAGIAAHSVGGGGGTGSDFTSVLGGQAGNGGNGGNAGTATVTSAGAITTSGDHAYGVLAQSIAGSGGAGGVETGGVVALGGDGAGGGTAGEAIVRNSGDITTDGYSAHGIVIQSIGGGGGAAGSASGLMSVGGDAAGSTKSNGGEIMASNTGTILTSGDAAIGLVAQSVGGGGGSGGDSEGIAGVGGKGSAGGDGSSVNITNLGAIETAGDYAYGVLAQSVGGGGGNGGDVLTISTIASIGIGGSAAGGGNGGNVCIDNTGVSCSDSGGPAGAAATIVTHGDYATGLAAQSVGGGGGNGGSVQNYSLASFLALQVGGNGGGGGIGESATIRQNDLQLSTSGAHAIGVLAQSIGGGGGNGGDASYFDATIGFNAALIVGGGGGGGGYSSAVMVDLANATVITGAPDGSDPATFAPNDSFGILAQSIGGGGGNGGSTSAKDFVLAAPTGTGVPVAFNYQAAVGGNGGNGGDGCQTTNSNDPCTVSVSLTDGTSVTTLGDGSHAVVAQAIGGGGGNGGDSSVLSTTLGDKDTVELTAGVSLGGGVGNLMPGYEFSSSNGGWGGLVDVTLGDPNGTAVSSPPSLEAPPSAIRTYGDYANGVVAQSIGGGGGNAGIGSSDVYSQGGVVSIKASIGLGGVGGAGGSSELVTVTQNRGHAIQTYGSGSRGIVAQSIGGGGGASQGGTLYLAAGVDGYDGRLTVGVGMTGGSGGDSGGVTATTAGTIATTGGDADGVLLQAIGGGGGLGGSLGADASSHAILDRIGLFEDNKNRLGDGGAYTLTVDVGGKGGTGGHGGAINLDHIGQIDTSGDWADGIVAQSIGGGGGAGGSSTASGSKVTASIAVSVGGKGGTGGNGGEIDANFDGDDDNHINTAGYSANAVVLQSIGGGGGTGGDGSDKSSGTITVGGSAGGTGGTAGDGGTINVKTASWLTAQTLGDDSIGILAQSIGGGGGIGGAGNSSGQAEVDSYDIAVVVGGQGGVSGNGGTIGLSTGTSMNTYGDRAYGILAQSIGGGGGIGGAGSADNLASVVLGGQGGVSGNGSSVSLDIAAGSSMNTRGAGAHAIVAQSIGGGGGIGGDASGGILSTSPILNAPGGNSGNGNLVDVTVDANITTSGANAFGILAQSIGGGGGFGGDQSGGFAGNTSSNADGTGSTVTVSQTGMINATGAGSVGIFAQSQGTLDQQAVTVDVNGAVAGGSGDFGAGIWIAAGKNNVLTVNTGGSVSAASGTAIRFDGDASTSYGSLLTVNNSGTITGDILLNNTDSSSAGTINNQGTINPAATKASDAGASAAATAPSGGTLVGASLYEANVVNGGTLVVGHGGKTDSTEITGNFAQSADGTLSLDLDMASGKSDRLTVRGDAALGGTLDINATSLLPRRELVFLSIEGAATGALETSANLAFDIGISKSGQDYSLSTSADFDRVGLDRSTDEIADHLQEIWDADGNDDFGSLFATLYDGAEQGDDAYVSMLAGLLPGVSLAPAARFQRTIIGFNDSLMSCPKTSAGGLMLGETSCVWADISGGSFDQNGSSGYSDDAITYRMGTQVDLAPGWFLGLSGAYQHSKIDGDDGLVSGSGDAGFLGAALKREVGPWLFAGVISGSYGSYDMQRGGIPGAAGAAESSPDVYGGALRFRVARTFANTDYYIKPYLDLDAVYTRMSGYTESGAGVAGLRVEGSDQFAFVASPMIEIGGSVALGADYMLRPYAYAGASLSTADEWTADARLSGAPAGVGMFEASLPMDDVLFKVGAGLHLSKVGGMDIELQYAGAFSDETSSNSGMLRINVPF
ncbi:autotransporter outer membrane beta-barrel domain-containing protein [Mesorhizobium sp. LHD-90]|uniref:autotransporter outer membrane beta-barrel domain-containing protein n=1 Tax=Mesorhizobium sp. LHD-90 TaxID=3071414 RepID=UPI0027DECA13|nr:autotransporter outer membrane beta-barrel domain-containing protein [Mesorhizobium sp. LHD-90]MDQ6437577.1 autotransporter outer membrane beta-barrel domain-containing protein [Mesorhizobium sp. LHD-90]